MEVTVKSQTEKSYDVTSRGEEGKHASHATFLERHLMGSSHEGFAGPAQRVAACALWTYTEPLAGQMHDVNAIFLVFKRDENTIHIHALFMWVGVLRGYTAGRGWGFLWVVRVARGGWSCTAGFLWVVCVARGGWSHTARFLWVVRVARGGWSIRVIV